MDRYAVREMFCLVCKTAQPIGPKCITPGCENKADYYCDVCKYINNDPSMLCYHCADCGLCRVGRGALCVCLRVFLHFLSSFFTPCSICDCYYSLCSLTTLHPQSTSRKPLLCALHFLWPSLRSALVPFTINLSHSSPVPSLVSMRTRLCFAPYFSGYHFDFVSTTMGILAVLRSICYCLLFHERSAWSCDCLSTDCALYLFRSDFPVCQPLPSGLTSLLLGFSFLFFFLLISPLKQALTRTSSTAKPATSACP